MNNSKSFKIYTQNELAKTPKKSCSKCLKSLSLESRINFIRNEYLRSDEPWIVGFSGGKDSTAVVKLLFAALSDMEVFHKEVRVIYCDTGVEIPIMKDLVYSALNSISNYSKKNGLPVKVQKLEPKIEDRYFVKVIGRGYPSPTNKFRWCTDRLRINPVQNLLKSLDVEKSTVLVGTRYGESAERDRILDRNKTMKEHYYIQSGRKNVELFAPVSDFTTEEIWSTILSLKSPRMLGSDKLLHLYRDAGGECPIIRDSKGTPCGAGRFGCWTCTVVRKDKAMTSLVENGYDDLKPLLNFRNWLSEFRDEPKGRCRTRRNGALGLGPFTLEARKRILRRLRIAQSKSGIPLIYNDELTEIFRLWKVDRESSKYFE